MATSEAPVWRNRLHGDHDSLVLEYCSGRDVCGLPMADSELLPYDLWTTEAHDIMLHAQGVLTDAEIGAILAGVRTLRDEATAGRFQLDPGLEDVHMNVESRLSALCGADVGEKVHTGRSRNDQVACDMRMYMRDRMLELGQGTADLCRTLLDRVLAERRTVMPGFSHTRHATVTTAGHWLAAYAQALCRDLERILFSLRVIDASPLGAAAGFGTSWPIDRELTARLLGFERVEANTMDCVSNRWEADAQCAAAVSFLMTHLAQMAQDIIFLSTFEARTIILPDSLVQGSSIMPQKRNPDPLEVTRSRAAVADATLQALLSIPRGGISGYNRDLQQTKYLTIDLFRDCGPAPRVMQRVIAGMSFEARRAEELARGEFLNAVDVADHLCRAFGLPFRRAYTIVADAVRRSDNSGALSAAAVNEALAAAGMGGAIDESVFATLTDPLAIVERRRHTGAPAPDMVEAVVEDLRKACDAAVEELARRRTALEEAWAEKERRAAQLVGGS
jgi:argininosuccinate lyase